MVWHVGYQDVIAIGKLFTRGELCTDRIVALAGPQVNQPILLRTRLGASLSELTAGKLKEGDNRIISGSVLSGTAFSATHGYLGRFISKSPLSAKGVKRVIWLGDAGAR